MSYVMQEKAKSAPLTRVFAGQCKRIRSEIVPKTSLLRYIDSRSKPFGMIMDTPNTILVYSDYKSPYAFLAKDLIYELEDQFDVHLEWLPYALDIPSYLGSARLDERGEVIEFKSERPPVAQSALLVHGLPATSPKARARNSGDAQNMGLFYRRHRHVVG